MLFIHTGAEHRSSGMVRVVHSCTVNLSAWPGLGLFYEIVLHFVSAIYSRSLCHTLLVQ